MQCMWCSNMNVDQGTKDCYWILPDGKDAVHILQIPALVCVDCGSYLTDEMNHDIDMALYARELPKGRNEITYEELMSAPYKNIFDIKNV
ncbi:YgiT-type zinc finger protein [Anaerobacillus sp. CMMVII]|uniref:YokU family protein n=1 Tax=Anaerobacillus sp. CMMVII TaxID=2755588 RepID=UPI0021B84908|nr:YokU family protein [Anaerobacillus sp. CMMVII]MCT8138071.1 YgiT-type zinc finger protein [Anaerobacillus sp. CMMVII]